MIIKTKYIFALLLLFAFYTKSFARQQKTINVIEKGVLPQVAIETDEQKYDRWSKIKDLFEFARKNHVDLFFPKGLYDVGNRNFPFRSPDTVQNDNLLDCGNITIYGEGGTIFMTSSVYGADVLQLNQVKNISFKNIEITATLQKYEKSGSNGISITNGFDNINLENIRIYNLPGVDKKNWVDGSKGLTIQSDIGSKGYMGTVNAKGIVAENVAYGFRLDTGHVSDILKNYKTIKINIDILVKNAFQGFSMEFGKSLNNIPQDTKLDITAKVKLIDCQQFVRFARVIGGNYIFEISKTKRYDQITKDQNNHNWVSEHDGVFAFLSNYTKNASVRIVGNAGEVDTKVWIGAVGSVVEPFNLGNKTENNDFYFDISGSSKTEGIRLISYMGDSVNNNTFKISKKTSKKVHNVFRTKNTLTIF